MIFDTVIYVTLINLTNGMYSSTTTKEVSISMFMCFRIFNFGQIKMKFCGDENFKYLLNVYKCNNCIKIDTYLRTNSCLVINLKQNRFEIK